MLNPGLKTAVLLPCKNEAVTIEKVIKDFKRELPLADIYVFDNCSTDNTSEVARNAGANVVFSPIPGKGNCVRHMFQVVEADIYIMADGDDTYPPSAIHGLLEKFHKENVDMVVGTRIKNFEDQSFRRFHQFGNKLVAFLINLLFPVQVSDVMSGYRVFSRHIVKTIPLTSSGFEVETELTLQATHKKYSISEAPINYGIRPEGSFSKLNTYSDGALVLRVIFMIFKDYKPLAFFSFLALISLIASLVFGYFPIMDYVREKFVHRVPLAILASGLGILSVLFLGIGLILNTMARFHLENFEQLKKLQQEKK